LISLPTVEFADSNHKLMRRITMQRDDVMRVLSDPLAQELIGRRLGRREDFAGTGYARGA
jgi:hypothetical protein